MNPAYAYIYDDFLMDQRYQDILDSLETKLAGLGLSGRIGRLTLFRNSQELVEDFVRQGVKNLVIVGNDNTLDKVMWFLPDLPLTMGYIPLAEPSGIARLLNIPTGLAACEVLSARLIETLDVAKLNDRYFISEVIFENTTATLSVDEKYKLTLTGGGTLSIRNLGHAVGSDNNLVDAQDGLLEVVLTPQGPGVKSRLWTKLKMMSAQETKVTFKSGEIVSAQPMEGQADRFGVSGFKFSVSIVPQKFKVITGRRLRPVM
ncbi:MAG: hypothetical protein WC750_00135 [Patescibacteria group bacterium]|jgi:diacylglycerol kinase family enzyme